MAEDPKSLRETVAALLAVANKTPDPLARRTYINLALTYHERALTLERTEAGAPSLAREMIAT